MSNCAKRIVQLDLDTQTQWSLSSIKTETKLDFSVIMSVELEIQRFQFFELKEHKLSASDRKLRYTQLWH